MLIWGSLALAFNVLMGYTGMISFGPAASLGIGGYAAGLLLKNISGFPFLLALMAALFSGALAALIIGSFCIRLTQTYFAMLTLAFSMIVYYIACKWYDFTGGDNGLIGIPVPAWVQDPTCASSYRFVLGAVDDERTPCVPGTGVLDAFNAGAVHEYSGWSLHLPGSYGCAFMLQLMDADITKDYPLVVR